MKQTLLVLLAALLFQVRAQSVDPVLSAELALRSAHLGDAVALDVVVLHEPQWTVQPAGLGDAMGKATVISQQWEKPVQDPQTQLMRTVLRAQLAWYELGEHQLPTAQIKVSGPEGREVVLETPEITIEIVPLLEEGDQELAPAKGQADLPLPTYYYVIAGLLAAALLGLIVWLIMRRNKGQQSAGPPPKPLAPPHVEALEALGRLTGGGLLKEGRVKAFYVAINQIIRHYYHRLYAIHAEEMTSEELAWWFEDHPEVDGMIQELNRDFQELCDRVKYAKYDPHESEHNEVVNLAYKIVELLKPQPQEAADVASA